MSRKCRVLVAISIFAFFFFSSLGLLFSRETETGFDQELVDKLVEVYDQKGEEGLRNYASRHRESLEKKFVYDLANSGLSRKKVKWLDIALVLAEKSDIELLDVYVYTKMGEYYLNVKNIRKGFECLRKILPFAKKLKLPTIQKYLPLLSDFVNNYENILLKPTKMLSYLDGLSSLKKDEVYEAGLKNIKKAEIISVFGDIRESFHLLSRALELFKKQNYVPGQAKAYIGFAKLYSYYNLYAKSIEMSRKALAIYEAIGDRNMQIDIYLKIAADYKNLGEYELASESIEKALKLAFALGDRFVLAEIYRVQGTIYAEGNFFDQAFKTFDKAYLIFNSLGSDYGMKYIRDLKIQFYFQLKEYSKAFKLLEDSLRELDDRKAVEVYGEKNTIFDMMGGIYLQTNKFSKALEFFEKANIENSSLLLFDNNLGLARVHEALNNKEIACKYYVKAMEAIEKDRKKYFLPAIKEGKGEYYSLCYGISAEFFFNNEYFRHGFKAIEIFFARLFLEKLSEGMIRVRKGITQELAQKRDALILKLSEQEKLVLETSLFNTESEVKIQKEHYRQIESEFEDLLIKIRLECPLYSSIRYFEPVTVERLQEKLLKEGEFLLRFFSLDETVGAFIISRDSFRVLTLDGIDLDQLKELVGKLKNGLSKKRNLEFSRVAHQAYKEIFKPLEKYLEGAKDLIIVPDGELALIPFEALIVERGSIDRPPVYLLEKYRIKYVQSASVLGILREHYRSHRKTNRFFGFGDPVYDYENFLKSDDEQDSPTKGSADEVEEILRIKYDGAGGSYNRLKGTGEEVLAIAKFFNELDMGEGVVRLRQKALEEEVKSEAMKEYDYIHFACHGLLAEGLQSLVLSQDIPKHSEDGYLTLNEIMNCEFNAKLVVLSACETGSENEERGEGVTGLTRAVMYAGTPAVVASLWKVDDKAAKELMVLFYENLLKHNMSKSEALRQAKLSLLNSETYSSPRHWSAFVMYGE